MQKSVIRVDGMACQHCVKAVTNAVLALPGIGGVDIDLAAGTVTVEHDPSQSPLETIKAQIEEQGYDIAD